MHEASGQAACLWPVSDLSLVADGSVEALSLPVPLFSSAFAEVKSRVVVQVLSTASQQAAPESTQVIQ